MTIRARSSIDFVPFAWPRMPMTVSSATSSSSTVKPSRTSAPDSAAAFTRSASSTVRRGQKPPIPSFASGIVPRSANGPTSNVMRSEEHTSELQSQSNLVCRLLLEKKKKKRKKTTKEKKKKKRKQQKTQNTPYK